MLQILRVSGFFLVVGVGLSGCSSSSAPLPDPALPTEPEPPATEECFYSGGTLPSLEVAAGETCTLISTVIRGDITLAAGASLVDTLGIAVEGNVQGQGASSVSLEGATIGGDVQLEGGGAVDLTDSNVEGDVRLIGHNGALGVSDDFIEGDVQLSQNTGGVFVDFNFVSGGLQCERNDPAPTGSDNEVAGSKQGQCLAL